MFVQSHHVHVESYSLADLCIKDSVSTHTVASRLSLSRVWDIACRTNQSQPVEHRQSAQNSRLSLLTGVDCAVCDDAVQSPHEQETGEKKRFPLPDNTQGFLQLEGAYSTHVWVGTHPACTYHSK